MSPGGFRADLQGLRGISVLLVLLFHLQVKGAAGGFIGVDVFFVISGYLMTQIILGRMEEGRFGYWRFMGARAARIWPALGAMLALLYLAGAWALPPFDLQNLADQSVRALLFVSNQYFLSGAGYITHAGDTLWLLHTWSLSVEWQFYLLYPLLLMGVVRAAGAMGWRPRVAVIVALAAFALASLGCHLWLSARQPDAAFFLLPARAWELLAGGLAFLLPRPQALTARGRGAMSHLGLLLVLGAAMLIAGLRLRSVGIGAWLLLPVLGTALILWAGHAGHRLLGMAPFQKLGAWSYAIYLWHWPLIIGLRMTELPLDRPLLTAATTIMAAVLLGWGTHAIVERPTLARAPSGWRLAARPASLWVLALVCTGVVTGTHGLAFRARAQGLQAERWDDVKPLYFPDACSNYKKPVSELKICPVRKAGAARVLVIGDSHAEHLYAWFVKNSPVSVDFYSVSECPPVPRFRRMQPGYVCEEYAALAWRKAMSDDYDTVVVSARWPTAGLAGAPYCHLQGDGLCVAPATVSAKQALLLAELKAVLLQTLQAGKTVVMLDGAPESRFRVAERLARERFWYGEARLAVPTEQLVALTGWMEPLFAQLQTETGFHRISVRDRLCDATRCRVHDNRMNRAVFFDESHFDPIWIAGQRDLFQTLIH